MYIYIHAHTHFSYIQIQFFLWCFGPYNSNFQVFDSSQLGLLRVEIMAKTTFTLNSSRFLYGRSAAGRLR